MAKAKPARRRGALGKERPKTLRLSHGEFYWPSGKSRPEVAARQYLLDAIQELAPEVASSLRDEVFPIYRRVIEALPENHRILMRISHLDWKDLSPSKSTAAFAGSQTLADAIELWSDRFCLNVEWFKGCAVRSLTTWYLTRWRIGEELRQSGSIEEGPASEVQREFIAPNAFWWIEGETAASFREHAREAFKQALADYIDDVSAKALKKGFKRTPTLYEKLTKDARRDVRLFVRWQVQSWTLPALRREAEQVAMNRLESTLAADRSGVKAVSLSRDRKGLLEALERVAASVGLRRRRGAPGRPRATR